jgi:hypothetical protein
LNPEPRTLNPLGRAALAIALVTAAGLTLVEPAAAQPAAPRIGPFVFDVRGTFPKFPDAAQLAQSRGIRIDDLPGAGLGIDLGAHLYLFKWGAITFGVGGELMTGRSRSTPPAPPSGGSSGQGTRQVPLGQAVTERFTSLAPQISLNFGTGNGWSYLSAGLGQSTWSIVPDGTAPRFADQEYLQTINYGGGARWFVRKHLAFTFDVRFYAINPGTPELGFPGSPRTTLLVLGAGASVR